MDSFIKRDSGRLEKHTNFIKMHQLISAAIITFNEEINIERCILSVRSVADEIIVLDSFSSDKTVEICKSLGVKVIQRKWDGYSASKNYLNSQAKHSYILSIDADEELSPELQTSILKLKSEGLLGVYEFSRLTNYCGNWIKYSGWYPDIKTRIFPKDTSIWIGDVVHETLSYSDDLQKETLKGELFHYSYVSEKQHRERADKYSTLTAVKYNKQGKTAYFFTPILSAFGRFISMFLFKKGFLDGMPGFKIAYISACSNYFKYAELRRLNREN